MTRIESDYYAHMGYDPAHTRKVRSYYAQYFENAEPVLELACGRGEFLTELAARGIRASGVDIDSGMVEAGRANGLNVFEGDALAHLEKVAPGSLGGVFCAHFLEHLQPAAIADLLDTVARALRPGGVFAAVLPNPACYSVLTHDFWCDPTHVRFYDLPLVEFFCVQAGLVIEASGTNPLDHPGPPPGLGAELVLAPDDTRDAVEYVADTLPDEVRGVGVLIDDLLRRLAVTNRALRELESAHRALLSEMYPGNEIYVVARR